MRIQAAGEPIETRAFTIRSPHYAKIPAGIKGTLSRPTHREDSGARLMPGYVRLDLADGRTIYTTSGNVETRPERWQSAERSEDCTPDATPLVDFDARARVEALSNRIQSLRERAAFWRMDIETQAETYPRPKRLTEAERAELEALEAEQAADPIYRKMRLAALEAMRDYCGSLPPEEAAELETLSPAQAAESCARKDAESLDSEAREEAQAATRALELEGTDPSADAILRAAAFYTCGFRPEHADTLIRFGVAIGALADGQRIQLPGYVPEDALRFADQWTREPHRFLSGPELEREALRLLREQA